MIRTCSRVRIHGAPSMTWTHHSDANGSRSLGFARDDKGGKAVKGRTRRAAFPDDPMTRWPDDPIGTDRRIEPAGSAGSGLPYRMTTPAYPTTESVSPVSSPLSRRAPTPPSLAPPPPPAHATAV